MDCNWKLIKKLEFKAHWLLKGNSCVCGRFLLEAKFFMQNDSLHRQTFMNQRQEKRWRERMIKICWSWNVNPTDSFLILIEWFSIPNHFLTKLFREMGSACKSCQSGVNVCGKEGLQENTTNCHRSIQSKLSDCSTHFTTTYFKRWELSNISFLQAKSRKKL